jgi:hypothetical protein
MSSRLVNALLEDPAKWWKLSWEWLDDLGGWLVTAIVQASTFAEAKRKAVKSYLEYSQSDTDEESVDRMISLLSQLTIVELPPPGTEDELPTSRLGPPRETVNYYKQTNGYVMIDDQISSHGSSGRRAEHRVKDIADQIFHELIKDGTIHQSAINKADPVTGENWVETIKFIINSARDKFRQDHIRDWPNIETALRYKLRGNLDRVIADLRKGQITPGPEHSYLRQPGHIEFFDRKLRDRPIPDWSQGPIEDDSPAKSLMKVLTEDLKWYKVGWDDTQAPPMHCLVVTEASSPLMAKTKAIKCYLEHCNVDVTPEFVTHGLGMFTFTVAEIPPPPENLTDYDFYVHRSGWIKIMAPYPRLGTAPPPDEVPTRPKHYSMTDHSYFRRIASEIFHELATDGTLAQAVESDPVLRIIHRGQNRDKESDPTPTKEPDVAAMQFILNSARDKFQAYHQDYWKEINDCLTFKIRTELFRVTKDLKQGKFTTGHEHTRYAEKEPNQDIEFTDRTLNRRGRPPWAQTQRPRAQNRGPGQGRGRGRRTESVTARLIDLLA